MLKEKNIKFVVKENGEKVAEFWLVNDALEYVEKFGGEVFKVITTVEELERIADGVWAQPTLSRKYSSGVDYYIFLHKKD